jgi:hypothetical protein
MPVKAGIHLKQRYIATNMDSGLHQNDEIFNALALELALIYRPESIGI